jgi:anthranilate synthase component 1
MVSRGKSGPSWQVILLLIHFRFDAFRSIFPAGTVSGAPKIKAIELVYELEQERRGVYAGAVGRFDFANDAMDTCIAIRTTVFKDGVAYLQAGGGIVHDSVEEDEYNETINKLKGNAKALEDAERELLMISEVVITEYPRLGYWYDMQQAVEPSS